MANRRAFSWRDVKAISPKLPKIQTANGTAIYWGFGGGGGDDVIECKRLARNHHMV